MNNRAQKALGSNVKRLPVKPSTWIRKNAVVVIITLGLTFGWIPVSSAQEVSPHIWQVRAMQADRIGISEPIGLAFSSRLNAFYTMDAKNWRRSQTITDLFGVTVSEDQAGSARLDAAVQDPINVAYDNQANRLLILQAQGNQLLEVLEGPDGRLDPATLTRHNVVYFGVKNPQGLTVDPATGDLLILDAAGPRIVRISGGLDNGVISVTDLGVSGITTPRGIAFDPSTGHLHVASPSAKILYELTQAGELIASRDLAQFDLQDIQGIVFAPSGDQTDDPSSTNLYLTDSGLNAGQATSDLQSTGQIMELSMTAPAALPAGTTLLPASLVQIIDTSNKGSWSPSSPDPAGVDYLPSTDPAQSRLVVSDSEVDEMPNYFAGKNVFLSTTSGTLTGTCSTMAFTNEPTGVAVNPANNHIFFSTDDTDRIFEISLGNDGAYCTADDTLTTVNVTSAYGITDAEDVAYGDNTIFIAGGIDAEVYSIPLGANGVLGGDDGVMSHFDTAVLGFTDMEAIGYNLEAGTLFIASPKSTEKYLGEVSIAGALVNAYDLALMGSGPYKRSDVAYAPGSQDLSTRNIYIASRNVDNNNNASENDGQIWEIDISLPPADPEIIFKDSFESGTFSAWSVNKIDGGDLSVRPAAALIGAQGMQAVIDDTVTIFVTSDHPNAEPRYRARFYFDPNSLTMASGNAHVIFNGLMGTSTVVTRVEFRYSSGAYQIRGGLINDATTWSNTSWVTIGDAAHSIEVDWSASTAAGANNGGLTLWIDGTQQATRTGVDNDTRRIDRARLGAVTGIDSGTQGTYYFDAFESRRQTYIGP